MFLALVMIILFLYIGIFYKQQVSKKANPLTLFIEKEIAYDLQKNYQYPKNEIYKAMLKAYYSRNLDIVEIQKVIHIINSKHESPAMRYLACLYLLKTSPQSLHKISFNHKSYASLITSITLKNSGLQYSKISIYSIIESKYYLWKLIFCCKIKDKMYAPILKRMLKDKNIKVKIVTLYILKRLNIHVSKYDIDRIQNHTNKDIQDLIQVLFDN